MHWGELVASLLGNFWLPPTRRSPNDTTSRLSDWAGWGLFAINLLVALFVGAALLFGTH
jgi:hypothetical protein